MAAGSNNSQRLALGEEIARAAQAVQWVRQGHPLPDDLSGIGSGRQPPAPPRSRAAIRDMTFRAIRQMGLAEAVLGQLNRRPPHAAVLALQLVAIEQLINPLRDTHTIVDQAVQAARSRRATRGATGLINAVLRRFLREQDTILAQARRNPVAQFNFPRWWITQLQREYPDNWQQVLNTLNEPAPMTLRVNRRSVTMDAYLARCAANQVEVYQTGPDAVTLAKPCDVSLVPGFAAGEVSVQDAGAQLAAHLLDAADGMQVLDACAAPGGKTAHLLERFDLGMTAIDRDGKRLEQVRENLQRLHLDNAARLVQADAGEPDSWYDGTPFDRILVDAPCTASGIVRRHPEIRWLRQRRDIETLAAQQQKILRGLWPTLKPGGKLLYATCSVFTAEGEGVVDRFVREEQSARRIPLMGQVVPGHRVEPISQLLPVSGRQRDHDGFFYALISKVT